MSPKTLTGEELELDDAPAREAELFLVDGNNLAYRAFFALPEELATSEGFATGALLGFTNMLFKLLSDYRPKGVAVAWDTRPVHRTELAEDYKEGRRPMPDLLREQFPFFRPIVEAFGYRNLEFEGWEADDVIATLATRADAAGISTCVVSTDRDAFQLVTDNVCLMMTPRGVADVNVYTPERVEARLGITADKVPDFIGLKGDTSDNIAGVPGIGDKTASQLIAKYGSLEAVLEHVDEQTPARAQGAAPSTPTRRALEGARDHAPRPRHRLRPGRSSCSARPTAPSSRRCSAASSSAALLQRVDQLDEAVPAAAPREVEGERAAVARGPEASNSRVTRRRSGSPQTGAVRRSRPRTRAWSSFPRPSNSLLQALELVVHDAKALAGRPTDDTLLAAYLIEPGRAAYELDDLAAEYGARAPAGAGGGRGDGGARPPGGDPAADRRADARAPRSSAGTSSSTRRSSCRSTRVLADMEDAGVRIDTYRMGEITARLTDRVEELESKAYELAGEEFMLGSTQQVARILFEKLGLTPGPQGQDRLLDRHARPPDDPGRARDRRRARGVARADEADQHLPRPAAAS